MNVVLRVCVIVVSLVAAASAQAATWTVPVSSAGWMVSPDGERLRLLVDVEGLPDLGDVAVSHAALRVPLPQVAIDRDLEIDVRAVSRPWSPGQVDWSAWETPGGDVHPEWRSRAGLLRAGRSDDLSVDVTAIVQAGATGTEMHGFLVSVPDAQGRGFDLDSGGLLRAALAHASLEIRGQRTPARGERGRP